MTPTPSKAKGQMAAAKINLKTALKEAQAAEKVEFMKQVVNAVSQDYSILGKKLAKKEEELGHFKTVQVKALNNHWQSVVDRLKDQETQFNREKDILQEELKEKKRKIEELEQQSVQVKALNNHWQGVVDRLNDQKSQINREKDILQEELKEKKRKIEEFEQRPGALGLVKEIYQAYWYNITKATLSLFRVLKFIDAAAIQSSQISQEVEQVLTATSTTLVEAKAYRVKLTTSSDQSLVFAGIQDRDAMVQKMMDVLDKEQAGQQCKVHISNLDTTIANLKSHINSLILKGLPSPWTSNNKLISEEEYMELCEQSKKDQTNFDTWAKSPSLDDVIQVIKPLAELEVKIYEVMNRMEDFSRGEQLELQRCYRQFKKKEFPSEDEWKEIKASMDLVSWMKRQIPLVIL